MYIDLLLGLTSYSKLKFQLIAASSYINYYGSEHYSEGTTFKFTNFIAVLGRYSAT